MNWIDCSRQFGGRDAVRGDDGVREVQVFEMPEGHAVWEILDGPRQKGERWNLVTSGEADDFEQARQAALDALAALAE